jgi:hypothetical protein
MKRFILGFLILVAPSLFAQTVDLKNPYIFSSANGNQLLWYNESGTAVTQCRAGDTVVSQPIPLYYDEIRASFRGQSGDSAHWTVGYQFGSGIIGTNSSDAARDEGFYSSGGEGFVSVDSVNIVGTVPVGAKTGAGVLISDKNMKTGGSTHSIYYKNIGTAAVAISDSVVAYTNADTRLAYTYVKLVVIGQVNDEHEGTGSTSALLNKFVVIVRRFQ